MLVECSCSARTVTKRKFLVQCSHPIIKHRVPPRLRSPQPEERHRHYPASETTEAWHTYIQLLFSFMRIIIKGTFVEDTHIHIMGWSTGHS